jgi:hypothetical protein
MATDRGYSDYKCAMLDSVGACFCLLDLQLAAVRSLILALALYDVVLGR